MARGGDDKDATCQDSYMTITRSILAHSPISFGIHAWLRMQVVHSCARVASCVLREQGDGAMEASPRALALVHAPRLQHHTTLPALRRLFE